ncbi:DUF4351 domain-containing protein [aff. Roholtiella sp. LEGE 12411]|nr:DUF4351 domain-containing protein [aff. Roholtiella sp. LEGE 12411]
MSRVQGLSNHPLKKLQVLAEALLNFSTVCDLEAWLYQQADDNQQLPM